MRCDVVVTYIGVVVTFIEAVGVSGQLRQRFVDVDHTSKGQCRGHGVSKVIFIKRHPCDLIPSQDDAIERTLVRCFVGIFI